MLPGHHLHKQRDFDAAPTAKTQKTCLGGLALVGGIVLVVVGAKKS